jgi:hypothetical protein
MKTYISTLFGLLLTSAAASGQINSVNWATNYPKPKVQSVEVSGNDTLKPDWQCVSISITVVDTASNQSAGGTFYINPASPWGPDTVSCPGPGGAGYQALVILHATFVKGSNSEQDTKTVQVTVR